MKTRQRSVSGEANGEKNREHPLRPDQEERINAIVKRSAVLDTSKFMRIAVDWLLMSDIDEVIKKIVDAEKFPDYQLSKKTTQGKKGKR